MNPITWLAILTGALILVSAYYAWTIRRLLGTTQEMVSTTREMVETAWKTYALSVVPQIECRTVNCTNTEPPAAGEPPRPFVSKTTITNRGPHRLRLTRVRMETDSGGEQVRRFVDRWLVAGESEVVRIPLGQVGGSKVFVHFDDIASQSHVALSEQTLTDCADEA